MPENLIQCCVLLMATKEMFIVVPQMVRFVALYIIYNKLYHEHKSLFKYTIGVHLEGQDIGKDS